MVSCGMVSLLCSGAIAIGRVPSTQDIIPGVVVCGDTFCYQGIKPGETPHDDALAILGSVPDSTQNPNSDGYDGAPGNRPVHSVHALSGGQGLVSEVDFLINEPAVRAGDMVGALGIPCAVYMADYPGAGPLLVLAYRTIAVWVRTADWHLSFESPVIEVDLLQSIPTNMLLPVNASSGNSCQGDASNTPLAWKGFRQYP